MFERHGRSGRPNHMPCTGAVAHLGIRLRRAGETTAPWASVRECHSKTRATPPASNVAVRSGVGPRSTARTELMASTNERGGRGCWCRTSSCCAPGPGCRSCSAGSVHLSLGWQRRYGRPNEQKPQCSWRSEQLATTSLELTQKGPSVDRSRGRTSAAIRAGARTSSCARTRRPRRLKRCGSRPGSRTATWSATRASVSDCGAPRRHARHHI